MKKLLSLSIMCLLLVGVSQTQAQTAENPWGITVRTGLTGYDGDVGNTMLDFDNSNIAYGVELSYYLSNSFDLALGVTSNVLKKGNTSYDPLYSQRGVSFESNATTIDLLLRWKFVNTFAKNDTRFHPYLAAGIGASTIKLVHGKDQSGAIVPNDLTQWTFGVPFGLGMNVDLTDRLQFNFQAIYNRTFKDDVVDHVTGIDNNDHDDWLNTTVGLTFIFGGPEEVSGNSRMMESLHNIEGDVNDINDKMDHLIDLNEESIDALNALQEDLQMSDNQMKDLRAKFVRIVNNVQFAFDESYIIEPAHDELESLANVMQAYDNLEIHLEAYADERGSEQYNKGLASRRAQSVKDFLTQRGVDGSRIMVDVYGDTEELYDSGEKADQQTIWAQNRAVQVTLSYNGN